MLAFRVPYAIFLLEQKKVHITPFYFQKSADQHLYHNTRQITTWPWTSKISANFNLIWCFVGGFATRISNTVMLIFDLAKQIRNPSVCHNCAVL